MKKILCGVDIGGTKLSAGLVDQGGHLIDRITVYDHVDKPEDLLVEQLALMIKKLLKQNHFTESDLEGIGIGIAGHIRFRDGVVITTSNLRGFKNYPLREKTGAYFRVPVLVDNDANAQAFAEYKYGKGKSVDNLVYLTISTGIGAGIVINGKVYRGMTGTAGEFGHTIINPGCDIQCTCGNAGCLMSCACGLALPHLFKKKIEEGKKTTLPLSADFDYRVVDGRWLKDGLDRGDPLSREIILECADYMGMGLYNLFQVFNPPLILLGGGLMSWGDIYLDRIKDTFYHYARDMIYDPIIIRKTEISAESGMIGAASLLLE